MILKWVLIVKFAELSGYSQNAIQMKIKNGLWENRVHFIKGPDGKYQINPEEVMKWIENSQA